MNLAISRKMVTQYTNYFKISPIDFIFKYFFSQMSLIKFQESLFINYFNISTLQNFFDYCFRVSTGIIVDLKSEYICNHQKLPNKNDKM